ncbi:Protein C2-DOMAIN ABA-RELATED 11 [Bienertia sinuspersici]
MSNSEGGIGIGILKVLVVRGKRLVIRDFKSSDPYVKLKLGDQLAKTKVINSCLNPVWNEELSFSLSEPLPILTLEVFDKDRFKADDKMGYAHVNIQPLVSAAEIKADSEGFFRGNNFKKGYPGQ